MGILHGNFGLQPGCKPEDFNDGRLLLLDKPLGWSSFDLANKIRYLIKQQFGFKKIKVGHAGTLDPLATGLMLVCTGGLTKQIDTLMGMDKEYVASITFGSTTASYDLETEPEGVYEFGHIGVDQIEAALSGFLGKQMQTPPLFSAIRINGKRAYEHARKGHDMELNQREVDFKELELITYEPPVAKIRVVCSKGTYIRSFANDLGKAMQSGGHLSGLIRTAIGPFKLTSAQTVSQVEVFLKDVQTN